MIHSYSGWGTSSDLLSPKIADLYLLYIYGKISLVMCSHSGQETSSDLLSLRS